VTQTARGSRSAAGRHVLPVPTRRRRRPWVWLALAGVVLVGAFGVWLATGLLSASRTVQDRAGEAQASLEQFRDSLKVGDREQAAQHLSRGKSQLAAAERAAQRRQVRIASVLPYVGSTVSDLDHLLVAARIMTASATDALDVYRDFAGKDSKLFRNSAFSLPAIHSAQKSVGEIAGAMDRAEAELNAVTGNGPKGGQALEKKTSALAQVAALRAELVALGPVLDALPAAVGEGGRKTYLVSVLNPAEMRASGGGPLSVAFVRFDEGKMSIPLKGQTSVLTNNQLHTWKPVKGNPWGSQPGAFSNSTFNPDFPVSAEEMLRAARPNFGIRADGVIALDVVAISHLLSATGPVESAAYGSLTAENVAQKLVVDAYEKSLDQDARHDENDELMTLMLAKLTEGGGMIGKARALGQAVPGRHLQMYFRDVGLQRLVQKERSAGEVAAPEIGDLAAAYTQNGNGSKADVFQHRTVRETIRLRDDGSARIRRTVRIENRTPPYVGPGVDERRGYFTRWVQLRVMNLLPPGAKVIKHPTFQRASSAREGVDQDGRTFAEGIVVIPPGQTAELTWVYDVPRAAVRDGDGLRLLVYAETQSTLVDPSFELTVVAPEGWEARPGPGGWKAVDSGAAITVPMDRARLLQLRVSPSSS
jgi:hypothetical protein